MEIPWTFKRRCAVNADSLLVDTNIVVHVLNGNMPLAAELEGRRLFLSVVSRIELFSWPGDAGKRDEWLREFIQECHLVEMDRGIQDLTIQLRKDHKLALADAVIAATAKYLDLALLTANKGFKKLESEIKVIIVEP